MPERLIEFHTREELLSVLPHPVAASRATPEWLRQMPKFMPPMARPPGADPRAQTPEEVETVKNCMPFLEAMTYGYVLLLPADITFTMQANDIRADVVGCDVPLIDFH